MKIHENEPEICSSSTTPFSFTLRKTAHADKSVRKDYELKLQKYKDIGITISDHAYESNHTNNGIHCHGVMQIPKKFDMKRFRSRGWHIKLDEIYDYAGWLCYITKESTLESIKVDDSPQDPSFKMPLKRLFT